MFSLFKINDPYRLIAIVILAFAIKLPYMLGGCDYPEMYRWLLIGEAVGSTTMYLGVFDSMAPLASFVYWFIVLLFGKSTLALHVLGVGLLVVQAVIFNNLTIRNKVFEQNTYLPAFTYLIIASSHYSLSVFSPVQIGMTFILLAFGQLLSHVEFRAKRDEQIMSIGLLIGLASMFYLRLIIFLPIIIIILLVFTSTLSRRYIIITLSTLIPLFIAMAYYWIIQGSIGYFLVNFINPEFDLDFSVYADIISNYILLGPLLLFWTMGFITMPKQRRLNNYQNRLAQLFFVSGILSLSIISLANTNVSTVMVILLPISAFFASHLFFLIKKPLTDLGVSLAFIGITLFIAFDTEFNISGLLPKVYTSKTIAADVAELIKEKRIWVIGDDIELYNQAKIGTSFYNYALSKPVLDNLEYYDNLVLVANSVNHFKPEVILDYNFQMKKIMKKVPALAEEYNQVRPFVWVRK